MASSTSCAVVPRGGDCRWSSGQPGRCPRSSLARDLCTKLAQKLIARVSGSGFRRTRLHSTGHRNPHDQVQPAVPVRLCRRYVKRMPPCFFASPKRPTVRIRPGPGRRGCHPAVGRPLDAPPVYARSSEPVNAAPRTPDAAPTGLAQGKTEAVDAHLGGNGWCAFVGPTRSPPHAVGITHGQRVIATPHQHGASLTNLPGPRFTPIPSAAPFAVRREEHRQFGAAARGTHPPLTGINGARRRERILRDRQWRIPIH